MALAVCERGFGERLWGVVVALFGAVTGSRHPQYFGFILIIEQDGATLYFCSRGCRSQYEEEQGAANVGVNR